ncbi:amino acid racemase [Altererythrobacter salegens]|uniref:Amino acid racemase n=1 Tax=Croceibacterium salegens TaxID=1737568 RepID=A0A6I4SW98_9SPHN|nr:amino acid racemase [Croceibacterium salegens]MXO58622.1 amino acid racemase [Croceibacterium salegens]
MRKLGIIGGISWVSTRSYYEEINRQVQARTDRRHSAPLAIESVDFSQFYRLQDPEEWARATEVLIEAGRNLERSGAGALVIAANAMHKVYDKVAAGVDVPVFHIAEAVGEKMAADGVKSAALFGTRNVMTESFFRRRLVAHGIDLLPPNMEDAETLDRIIYDELMIGKVTRGAERALKTMITQMEQDGAKAIVLASTELDRVVDVDANVLPIYDSTRIHAKLAAEWILGED